MKYPTIAELVPYYYVCLDVGSMDVGLQSTIESFWAQVELRCRTRGWKQLMLLDLPKLGSVYDSGLSNGALLFSDIPECFGCSPHKFEGSWIFRSLLQHTFDSQGRLDEDTPPEVVAGTRQLLYFYKKARLTCPPEAIRSAVHEYTEIERNLRSPNGTWNRDFWLNPDVRFSESPELSLNRGKSWRFWETVDQVFARITPSAELHPRDVVPRHGPGAVSEVRTGHDKYRSLHWPNKLDSVFDYYQFRFPNESIGIQAEFDRSLVEPPAALMDVPKTYKGPRLIASEPVFHQFLQQGLMQWIRKNLPDPLRQCIDFTSQEPSRAAALQASQTGLSATVDLSSASDRLSCWVVERAFRSNTSLLRALHAVRSRVIVDRTGMDPDLSLQLKKFAAQGSAVTFPVQTIIYAGLAIASVLWDEGRNVSNRTIRSAAGKVQVFGDDIIIPSSSFATLAQALAECQLKVNVTKSHYRGHFRESCGMDAYRGHDVTPMYLGDVEPPTSLPLRGELVASWIDISNEAHTRGMWQTAYWMLSRLPEKVTRGLITSSETGGGYRAYTFCQGTRALGQRRWNKDLHRQELRALGFQADIRTKARGSWDDLYEYFIQEPDPLTLWKSGYIAKKTGRVRPVWVSR